MVLLFIVIAIVVLVLIHKIYKTNNATKLKEMQSSSKTHDDDLDDDIEDYGATGHYDILNEFDPEYDSEELGDFIDLV